MPPMMPGMHGIPPGQLWLHSWKQFIKHFCPINVHKISGFIYDNLIYFMVVGPIVFIVVYYESSQTYVILNLLNLNLCLDL